MTPLQVLLDPSTRRARCWAGSVRPPSRIVDPSPMFRFYEA